MGIDVLTNFESVVIVLPQHNNEIRGTMPAQLRRLSHLQEFNFEHNELPPEIPEKIKKKLIHIDHQSLADHLQAKMAAREAKAQQKADQAAAMDAEMQPEKRQDTGTPLLSQVEDLQTAQAEISQGEEM